MDGALLFERDPLVRVDEVVVSVVEKVVLLAENHSSSLSWDRLDVEGVLVSEVVLHVVDRVEDSLSKVDS